MNVFAALLRASLISLSAIALGLASSSRPGSAAEPLELHAILSLTGSAAFLGGSEAQSLKVVQDLVNRNGGIKGRQIRIKVDDDRSDPQTAIQLFNGLGGAKPAAILGPTLASTCSALLPLIEKNGPVMYCLSSVLEAPAGSYGFSAGVSNASFVSLMLNYFTSRGWKGIGLITSTDASGQTAEHLMNDQLKTAAGKGLSIVENEHFSVADLSTTAQVEKLKGAKPDVIVLFSTGTGFNTVLRAIHDAGIMAPVFASGSNMVPAQLRQMASVMPPGGLNFATSAGVVPDKSISSRARRDAQNAFTSSFEAAHIEPNYGHLLAWDPAMILVQALRSIGPDATAEQVHDYLVKIRNWPGDIGFYDFVHFPQRGLDHNAAGIYQWNPGKGQFAVVPFSRR